MARGDFKSTAGAAPAAGGPPKRPAAPSANCAFQLVISFGGHVNSPWTKGQGMPYTAILYSLRQTVELVMLEATIAQKPRPGLIRTMPSSSQAHAAASGDTAPFHSVSQLAKQLGVTARTIRFYEDKGLIAPQRAGTARVYTHRDRARLVLILRGKKLGFSLREIRDYLDLYDADPTHHLQTRQLLVLVRKRVAKLQEQRAAIDQSLAELTEIDRQCEAVLASQAE